MDKTHTTNSSKSTSSSSSSTSSSTSSPKNIISNHFVTPENCIHVTSPSPRKPLASVFECQNKLNSTKSSLHSKNSTRSSILSSRTSIKLEASHGLFDTISLFLGIIVGSGIFISAKIVAEATPNGGVSILVWLITGFYSILGALCFAELGTTFPESGGDFAYLRRLCGKKYGDLVAFLRIWVELLILRPGSQAAIAVTVAKYLIVPFLSTQVQNLWIKLETTGTELGNSGPSMSTHTAEVLVSILVTIILTVINIYSIKATQFCNALLSGIKVFVLLVLMVMGIVCISQVRMVCPIEDLSEFSHLESSNYFTHYFNCGKNISQNMVAYLSPKILFDFTSWSDFSGFQIAGRLSIACYAGMWSYAGWSDVNYRN